MPLLRHAQNRWQSKSEERDVAAAIAQRDDELAASARPCLIGLPDVAIGLGGWVVLQAAVACAHRHLNGAGAAAGAATHIL